MTNEISVFAPAKINLFLEVTSKRADGYHNIATLFAKIAAGDNIKISARKADKTAIELKIKGPLAGGLKGDKTNLAYKAAAAFLEHFGINAECAIRLEKNIPMAAGLGGGSSDAAAVIAGLRALFNIEINAKRMKDLIKLAAGLGADVPFFLREEKYCKGEGIGEVLTPVKNNIVSPWIVLVCPKEPSPTKEAYAGLQLNKKEQILTNVSNLNKIIDSIKVGNPLEDWRSLTYNKLEDCVFKRIASVSALKKELLALGADAAMMSGSGSCVFTLVKDKLKAKEIARQAGRADGGRFICLTHFWRTRHENHGNTDSSYGGRAA
ncbi:MAG: 4-(cytidine 5'-diphospho)-2-C-methyl-D-erythritol kinase [Elusimicrobiota bacterium]|jgi:4-diphosphocytidyl-2-C-methyl-D-erythritol kinase|nr:4-(cytidine 5'-diphospho)-2-C-methyl-D-erythritol kinase [Elusimicrobiota bacterium]